MPSTIIKNYIFLEDFLKFDYGTQKNMEVYNTSTPPPYNLTQSTAPVALFYASKDAVCGEEVRLNPIIDNI